LFSTFGSYGQAKKFCKNKFATWYPAEVQKEVDSGINFEDVDVDLLKPINATWLVEMYNFFTSTKGKVYVLKGWEKAGIKDVFNGKEVLLPVDPYQVIYSSTALVVKLIGNIFSLEAAGRNI